MKYKLIKVKLNEEIINLTFEDESFEDYKVKVTLDDYLEYKLKEGILVDSKIFNELKEKEKYTLAYRSALRRLSIKDYSIYKMRDSLYKKYELSKKDLDIIINNLISKDLLNDERYTKSKFEYLDDAGYSYRTIINKIKADGISDDLIKKIVKVDANKELDKAKKKANKYLKTVMGKSVNAKKQAMIQKLAQDGFNLDSSKSIVSSLDYGEDASKEKDLLSKMYNKLYTKYSKKLEGYELKNKIVTSLMSKGFNYDDINELVSKEEL